MNRLRSAEYYNADIDSEQHQAEHLVNFDRDIHFLMVV